MRFRSFAAAIILAVCPVGFGTAQADAAPSVHMAAALEGYADCPSDHFCIYANPNGDGSNGWGSFHDGVSDLGNWNGGSLGHHVGSVYNNTTDSWCLYGQPGYQGPAHVITSGGKVDLSDRGVDSLKRRGWLGC